MDPLSDMLSQIKNAGSVGKETVIVPHSKFKFAVAQVLLREGYVASVARKGKGPKRSIEITLAYENDAPRIRGARRVSKLSRRTYTNVRNIKPVRQGTGDVVLSTPKGILTGGGARKEKVGGEILFTIW